MSEVKKHPKIPKQPLETASTLTVTPYLPLLGQQYQNAMSFSVVLIVN